MIKFFKSNNLILIIIVFVAIISTGVFSLLSDKKSVVKKSEVENKSIQNDNNKKDSISINKNEEIRKDDIKKEIEKKEKEGKTFIKRRYDETQTDLKILDRKKFQKKEEDKINKKPFNFDSKFSFDNIPKEKDNNISKALAKLNKETAPDMEYINKNKSKNPFKALKNIDKNNNDNKGSLSSRYKSHSSSRNKNNEKKEIEQKIALYSSILNNNQSGILKGSSSISFYNEKTEEKTEEKNNEPVFDNKRTFNIIPGSSYYGELKNNIYNLYPNIKPIITINHPEFKNCRILGSFQESKNNGSITIELNQIACNDGTIQSVNGIAIRMGDLKPIFKDKVNRHLIPKIALVTLSSLLNGISLQDTPESSYGSQTIIDSNSKKDFPVNFSDAFSPNMGLVDEVLQEELSYYQTEIEVHPQALVVIFY